MSGTGVYVARLSSSNNIAMPLVIVSGMPLSGKTFLSQKLADHLISLNLPGKSIEIIREKDFCSDNSNYTSSTWEKKVRGNFISAVERKTTKDNIVIADGLNYIKGYRYQMYCIARAVGTPHCVLYCVSSATVARRKNEEFGNIYPPDILDELLMRFEEPDNAARWDSPLFTASMDDEPDYSGIVAALLGGVARPPSLATAVKITNSANLLAELDRVTQGICGSILDRVKQVGVPTSLVLNGSTLIIRKPVMGSELQRLRRQFIHMNRLHQTNAMQIEGLFIKYLQDNLAQ